MADSACPCHVLLFSSAPRRIPFFRWACVGVIGAVCICSTTENAARWRDNNTCCSLEGERAPGPKGVVAGVLGGWRYWRRDEALILCVVSLSCLPLGGLFSSFVSVCLSLLPRIYNSLSPFYTLSPKLQAFQANLIAYPALHFALPRLDTHSTEQLIALEREIDASLAPLPLSAKCNSNQPHQVCPL